MNCARRGGVSLEESGEGKAAATHVAVDPACARRGTVEARDTVVGEERGKDGAAVDRERGSASSREEEGRTREDAHEAADAVQRVRVDSVVNLEQDLDARRIVAQQSRHEADAESGGRAEVASAGRDADEAGDDARAQRDGRPLARIDTVGGSRGQTR